MAKMLSVGVPSTLGNWHKLSTSFFGADSEPTKYLKSLIDEQGEDEEVIADEGQFLMALSQMWLKGTEATGTVGHPTPTKGTTAQ